MLVDVPGGGENGGISAKDGAVELARRMQRGAGRLRHVGPIQEDDEGHLELVPVGRAKGREGLCQVAHVDALCSEIGMFLLSESQFSETNFPTLITLYLHLTR